MTQNTNICPFLYSIFNKVAEMNGLSCPAVTAAHGSPCFLHIRFVTEGVLCQPCWGEGKKEHRSYLEPYQYRDTEFSISGNRFKVSRRLKAKAAVMDGLIFMATWKWKTGNWKEGATSEQVA